MALFIDSTGPQRYVLPEETSAASAPEPHEPESSSPALAGLATEHLRPTGAPTTNADPAREDYASEFHNRYYDLLPAQNYIPDLYKTVLDQMLEKYSDPKLQTLIKAIAILEQVDEARRVDQLGVLKDKLQNAPADVKQAVLEDSAMPWFVGLEEDRLEDFSGKYSPTATIALLREMTETVDDPQLAGRILDNNSDTISSIAFAMGEAARTVAVSGTPNYRFADGHGTPDEEWIRTDYDHAFRSILRDLSAATSQAAVDPGNEQVIQGIAETLTLRLGDSGGQKVVEALVAGITHGDNPVLARSMVEYYRDAGLDAYAGTLATAIDKALLTRHSTGEKLLPL